MQIQGTHTTAEVFAEWIDAESRAQIEQMCSQPFVRGCKICIMPDVHAGAGCTVGTTIALGDAGIVPNLVGVDIGCGMLVTRVSQKSVDFARLDRIVREFVPSGFSIRNQPYGASSAEVSSLLSKLRCADDTDPAKAALSVGTLGGGNHFIEIDRGTDGTLYLVIHSGSRHLGLEVCKRYQRVAYRACNEPGKAKAGEIIRTLKAAGRESEIEDALQKIKRAEHAPVSREFCYLTGVDKADYLFDMRLVQRFAHLNRLAIADTVLSEMGLSVEEQFSTVHNYVDVENRILRKGAVSAAAGEKLIIPMNMRDGCLLCTGRGNPDWNWSAPHGAGRLMSRTAARARLDVDTFRQQMAGVYTTCAGEDTIDESPMAYKPMDAIVNSIGDTVRVDEVIKPVYNFKAGGE